MKICSNVKKERNMKNKRILVLASTFPASDSDPVPAFVKEQVIALKKRYSNLEISVLAPHDARSKTADYTKHEYFDEYRFHYAWPRGLEKLAGRGIMPQLKSNPLYYLLIPGLFLGELLATKRLIRKLHPDYLYAHWFTPQGVVAAIASQGSRTPVVLTTHASDVAVWNKIPLGGKIVRRYAAKAQAITAVSRRTLDKLRRFFTEEQWQSIAGKVRIIPMGIDFDTVPVPETPDTGQRITFIGRLAEKKGVQYLLPAFAKLIKNYPLATLTIAGDGPLLETLRAQTSELEISDQTKFIGWVDSKQKQELLGKTDIYVVPSIITSSGDAEGLPVSLMEGMRAGKLCIATNESGADDIINDKQDGLLIPQQDVSRLHQAMIEALSMSNQQKQDMQKKAAKTAERFGWGRIAEEHYRFLFE